MSATNTMRRLAEDVRAGLDTPTREKLAEYLHAAADVIDELYAQQDAARERVRWVNAGPRHYVAKVGLQVFEATGDATNGFRLRHRCAKRNVELGIFHCLDSTGRRIRAYRAGKWPRKGA